MTERRITELIETMYDIGRVTEACEIFGGFNNRSFSVRTNKDGCDKTYYVRKYNKNAARKEIGFEHALIRHAIGKGLHIVAGVVTARNGETLIQQPDSGRMFAVYDFLQGEDKYAWDQTNLTDVEFQNSARVLADFHDAVRDFDPGRLKRKEPPILDLLPVFADNFKRLSQGKDDGKFQSYFRTNLNAVLAAIDRNRINPENVVGMPVIPAHYDYHPGNLMWKDEQVVGLFDFDWSKTDLRLFDVGMAIVYFCTRWGGRNDGTLRINKFAAFLNGYQRRLQHGNGLSPLSDGELRLLPKMLSVADLYLIHWEVSDYFSGTRKNCGQYLRYLKHNVRLMRRLETHRSVIAETIADALK